MILILLTNQNKINNMKKVSKIYYVIVIKESEIKKNTKYIILM